MNIAVIFGYALIAFATSVVLKIIVKFLKEKSPEKQLIKDQIQIDLAVFVNIYVVYLCSVIIVREIVGPFKHFLIVETLMFFHQVKQLFLLNFQLYFFKSCQLRTSSTTLLKKIAKVKLTSANLV